MQFAGKKGTVLFISLLLVICAAGFGAGLLVGRHFPAHRFERFGNSRYVLETATGKICDPFKNPNESMNPFDHAFDPPDAPKDANGFPLISSYPPACGK
jgi:hypothetical protein